MVLLPEDARNIISRVNNIITDPSTMYGTPDGIGGNNVIIVILNSYGSHRSYTIATYVHDSIYPLKNECNIHREQTHIGTNQLT